MKDKKKVKVLLIRVRQDRDRIIDLESRGQVFGANIYIQPFAPESPSVGDIWYDISRFV